MSIDNSTWGVQCREQAVSLEGIQLKELRELLAVLKATVADVCAAQARSSTRRIVRLEDLTAEELGQWIRTLRFAALRASEEVSAP